MSGRVSVSIRQILKINEVRDGVVLYGYNIPKVRFGSRVFDISEHSCVKVKYLLYSNCF